MGVAVCINQHHPIGHIGLELIFPLLKNPAMARLFTAMAVCGQKPGL